MIFSRSKLKRDRFIQVSRARRADPSRRSQVDPMRKSQVKFDADTTFDNSPRRKKDKESGDTESHHTQSRASVLSRKSSVKVAQSELYDQQDDKYEALEYNGEDLPIEYLMAKLSYTRKEAELLRAERLAGKNREEDRRNTGFHFNKADIYNSTQGSFNQMLASEHPDHEHDEGLEHIVDDFQKKTAFLQVVKSNNRNQTREVTGSQEVHHSFVQSALNYGNLPLPLLLKIKRGIFYIPSLYTVTEGLSTAIRDSLKNLPNLNEQTV